TARLSRAPSMDLATKTIRDRRDHRCCFKRWYSGRSRRAALARRECRPKNSTQRIAPPRSSTRRQNQESLISLTKEQRWSNVEDSGRDRNERRHSTSGRLGHGATHEFGRVYQCSVTAAR